MGTLSILTSTIGSHQGSGSTLVFNESFITGLGNSVTFVRGTTATNEDFEPLLKTIPISGSRHEGGRPVENLSPGIASALWTVNETGSGTVTKNGDDSFTCDCGIGDRAYLQLLNMSIDAHEYRISFKTQTISGGYGSIPHCYLSGGSPTGAVTLDADGYWTTDIAVATGTNDSVRIGVGTTNVETVAGSIRFYDLLVKDVTGQANQNTSEYVSVGVLSDPYHGANIDGLKYFDTYNGNTFGTDLVTGGSDYTDPAWTTTNYTITANAGVAPDGSLADDIKCDVDGNNCKQAITVTSGAIHTLSAWVHSGTTGTHDWIRMLFGNAAVTAAIQTWFDLSNGCAVGNSSDIGVGNIMGSWAEDHGDGWYKIFIKGTIGSNTDGNIWTQNQTADGAGAEETTNSVWWAGTTLYEHDNVVAEADGYSIPAATTKGLLIEEARTNRADNADALASPDTIDLTADGTGDFTLSVSGTAAVTVAAGTATGTGFGQATAGTPVTFNLSVTGTVTLTLDSGALTQNANGSYEYNLEAGSFATSWIPNTIAGTTRDLEEVDGDASLYKDTMTITGEFNSGVDSGTGAIIFEFYYSAGPTTNRVFFSKAAVDSLQLYVSVGGSNKFVEDNSWTPGATKFAIAISPTIGESAVYINGVRLDATPAIDIGHTGLEGTIDTFKIGRHYNDTITLNGTLKNLKIYHELKDATWLAADSTP